MGAQLGRLGLSMSGRHGKERVVCSSFVRAGTATASHQTFKLDVMERVQFQQEQVRSVLWR